MCYTNGEEPSLSLNGWISIFPDGVPSIYITTSREIAMSSLHSKKGIVKKSLYEEAIKNAEIALKEDLFQRKVNLTWLNAQNTFRL